MTGEQTISQNSAKAWKFSGMWETVNPPNDV